MAAVPDPFPTPGTPEWGRMNRRRVELLRRSLRYVPGDPMPAAECDELAELQRLSLAALQRVCPLGGVVKSDGSTGV